MTRDAETTAALAGFRTEADELLREMEDILVRLDPTRLDPEELNALFRTVHTVKGTAGLFGLSRAVAFTHEVETVLDAIRDLSVGFDASLGGMLLECRDLILELIETDVADQLPTEDMDEREARLRTSLLAYGAAGIADSRPTDAATAGPRATTSLWRVDVKYACETYRDGFDPISLVSHLTTLGSIESVCSTLRDEGTWDRNDPEACRLSVDLTLRTSATHHDIEKAFLFVREHSDVRIECLDDAASTASSPPPAAAPDREPPAAARMDDVRTVRIPADRLDKLIDLVGELVTAGSANASAARKHGIKELLGTAGRVNGLVESIRDRALALRMVPVGDTFSRFRKIVREISSKLGKQVELVIRGADTELDKSMIESLSDPLVHIVRNALDHGIESVDQRVAAGKPEKAKLVLEARYDAGGVLITVYDDGAGLNRERILAKAVERELVAPNASLTDDEIADLIFEPGFSTAGQVTDLSGRGVGMDVVRRAIEALRGTVRIASKQGEGTMVQMRLPLTLAIIDGFHVGVADHHFVLPMECVVECINGKQLSRAGVPGAVAETIQLRGHPLPVLHLRHLFELEGAPAESPSVVVVRAGDVRIGVVLDQLMGEGQTVIKPLGDVFKEVQGIAGSSVLGSGEVALILDVPALVQLAVHHERQDRQAAATQLA